MTPKTLGATQANELRDIAREEAEAKRDSDRLYAEEARLNVMVVELFGKSPKKPDVVSFSADLAESTLFCKANRNKPRGLIDTFGNSGLVRDLVHHAKLMLISGFSQDSWAKAISFSTADFRRFLLAWV
ncbi:hypothetical protein [Quatrionicoccus australiensis]|uniref:hypothetical protein n=1 Tax=Quatrionicoccus australiensis TaxID=138118 RepID=UPI001CF9B68B|nr:hypothetical protein [Quatrionicoccus australiensis]MCB4362053.1 hypothetical protein [Quatrionicoccus australiensis]